MAAVDRFGAGVWVGVLLAGAALSARPAPAQGNLWSAIAVSPSKLDFGGSHGNLLQADAVSGALQVCQAQTGATDCKIVAAGPDECIALATPTTQFPNRYGVGSSKTREAAEEEALAECTKTGATGCGVRLGLCSSDDSRWPSPLPLPPGGKPGSVDPGLVGFWKLDVGSGIWVWQISANGTYTFHSEALDGTAPHNGTFTASNGKYTLHATNITWDDQGTYTMQGPAAVSMTGKLGTGTWVRIPSDPNP